jgi:hypothetical protein
LPTPPVNEIGKTIEIDLNETIDLVGELHGANGEGLWVEE